jgi:hypothetical protein
MPRARFVRPSQLMIAEGDAGQSPLYVDIVGGTTDSADIENSRHGTAAETILEAGPRSRYAGKAVCLAAQPICAKA